MLHVVHMLLLLFVLGPFTGFVVRGAATNSVVIGAVIHYSHPSPDVQQLLNDALWGMQAGAAAVNAEGGMHNGTVTLGVEHVNPVIGQQERYADATAAALDANPNMLLAAYTLATNNILSCLPVLEQRDAVLLNPVTFDPTLFDQFTSTFVNLRIHPRTEWFGLVSHLVGNLHLRRIAVIRTVYPGQTNLEYEAVGALGEKLIVEALEGLGLQLFRSVQINNGSTVNEMVMQMGSFLLSGPQAILFPGTPDLSMAMEVAAVKKTPFADTSSIYLATGNVGCSVFEAVFAGYALKTNDRVITVLEHASSSDASFPEVQQFRTYMAAIGHSNRADSNVAQTAYLSARFIAEVVNTMPILSRKLLKERIFQKSIVEVPGNSYGMFADRCLSDINSLALCECNQGLKRANLVMMTQSYKWTQIEGEQFAFSVTDCTPSTTDLKRPVQIIDINANAAERSAVAAGGVISLKTLSPHVKSNISEFARENATLNATLNSLINDQFVTCVLNAPCGSELPDPLPDNVPYFEPRISKIVPHGRADIILIDASIEQQLHACVSALAASGEDVADIHMFIGGGWKQPNEISMALRNSLITFHLPSATIHTFVDNAELDSNLGQVVGGETVVAFFVGVETTQEAATIITHLKASTGLTGYFTHQDIADHYDEIMSAATLSTSLASRIRFASSLLNWATSPSLITKEEHPLLYAYWGFLNGTNASPSLSTFQKFVASRAVGTILHRIVGEVTSLAFIETWYSVSLVSVDPFLALGPYLREVCVSGLEDCGCNRGARKVFVRSFTSIVDKGASGPVRTHTFRSCSVGYEFPLESERISPLIIGFVVVTGALIVGMGIFAGLFFLHNQSKDNKCAPKDSYSPFCIMFTDIQSSTLLWSRVPSEMPAALDLHHAIIRELINKYKCYEVKTIGDAFMVAGTDPEALVKCAVELQQKFLATDWGIDAFDVVYKDQELEKAAEEDSSPPTANDPNYSEHWNGLRVRIGVHFGMGEIVLDEVSKSYDYYGTVVNAAARIEALGHGGQLLVSKVVCDELKDKSLKAMTKPVGAVELRGVETQVELFEIEAVPGRSFLELRMDRIQEDATSEETGSVMSGISDGGQQSDFNEIILARNPKCRSEILQVAQVFNTGLSVVPEKDRGPLFHSMVKFWRIEGASSSSSNKAQWLLYEKIGKVISSQLQRRTSVHTLEVSESSSQQPQIQPELSRKLSLLTGR